MFLAPIPHALSLVCAANDAEQLQVANALGGEGVFEIQQKDKLFVPFGEYPHAKGLQKFDRESGQLLSQAFNNLSAKNGRLFNAGVPIFRGHPDCVGRADSDPSAPALGWVQAVEVANDGVNFAVKWNPDGETAISNAHFRFYSPHWLLRRVKGGIQPVKLISIGLTNNPRIPVPAIANDETDEMKLSPATLKILGFAENDTPTIAQLDAAISIVNDRAIAARTRFIDSRLADLVDSTRVLPGEQAAVRGELLAISNDAALDTRLAALTAAAPKLKTKAVSSGLSTARATITIANDEAARSMLRSEAIDKELSRPVTVGMSDGDRYAMSFNRAATKNPTLFSKPAKR